ncbi:MAG: hypothetical protein L6R35_006277 [Caloplaca aegaea]|nr:MAG: hypothetical protein L6R35_006277 [Caloplaca aegaea]
MEDARMNPTLAPMQDLPKEMLFVIPTIDILLHEQLEMPPTAFGGLTLVSFMQVVAAMCDIRQSLSGPLDLERGTLLDSIQLV